MNQDLLTLVTIHPLINNSHNNKCEGEILDNFGHNYEWRREYINNTSTIQQDRNNYVNMEYLVGVER